MRKLFRNKIVAAVYFLPYLFVFLASLYFPTDSDLGWHLKYGEYFVKHGEILRSNIFSTMMPGYPWANGSWGTDILTYLLFSNGGFIALMIAGATIVTSTFYFFSKAARLTIFQELFAFPVFVYFLNPINSSSFRGQQLSLLLLGVLFFVLSYTNKFPKLIMSVPLIFLLWVNIHEESFLGLAVFALWIITKTIASGFKKDSLILVLIMVISILATFVNPFGFGIHQVAISHLNDPLLEKINEYIPFVPYTHTWWNEVLVVIASFVIIVYSFAKKKFLERLPILTIVFVLLCMSLVIKRYAWPSYYLFFLLIPYIRFKNYRISHELFKTITIVFFVCCFSWVYVSKFGSLRYETSWNEYCKMQEVSCSQAAGQYLASHKLGYKLFSYYDWGGWLMWNYPSVKPSIDGRMHLWRDTHGYSAFVEYDLYLSGKKSINDSTYDIVMLPLDKSPLYNELSTLITSGTWELVYIDNEAGIVVRKSH